MATSTLGTNATTSIPLAMAYTTVLASGADNIADFTALANAILDDLQVSHPILPGSWSKAGQLFIPNRGWLKVLPGDWVAVDSRGWPILLSADTIANGLWTHTP